MRGQVNVEGVGRQLWRCKRWLVPGLLIALLAAFASGKRVHLMPPSLEPASAEFAAATTQVMVDFPGQSALLDTTRPIGPLAERAHTYARLAATEDLVRAIGREVGIDPTRIDARGPYNPDAQRIIREPTAERRATQLRADRRDYRLRFDTEQAEAVPIVLLYAQAPTMPEASKLANAGATALIAYVRRVQEQQGLPDDERLQLRQLGEPGVVMVNPGADRQIAVLAFIAAFAAWAVLVLLLHNLRRFLARQGFAAAARPPAATAYGSAPRAMDEPVGARDDVQLARSGR